MEFLNEKFAVVEEAEPNRVDEIVVNSGLCDECPNDPFVCGCDDLFQCEENERFLVERYYWEA